jgi:hypothetical protein
VDKEHIKGRADQAKGALKEAARKMTGDKEMQVRARRTKQPATSRTPHVKPNDTSPNPDLKVLPQWPPSGGLFSFRSEPYNRNCPQ